MDAGEGLIVNLEEFADLCGVTAETMRVHLRELGKDGAALPAWLIERGDRGRGYKIEAEGGVLWWREKRDADALADQARRDRLGQLRLELVGDEAEDPERLNLSGRQRKEEIEAAMAAVKYRRALGELVEVSAVKGVLATAAVEHRRRLQQLPAEFGIKSGVTADQVRMLGEMIEKAVGEFVDEITAPDAFAEQ